MKIKLSIVLILASVLLAISAIAPAQTSDTNPPELVEFDFNPKNVDVTAALQNVTVTARVTDDLSGAPNGFWVTFRSPSGVQFHQGFVSQTGGTPLDRTYSGMIEIPQYVESGTWMASVFLTDMVGNLLSLEPSNLAALALPTDLDVFSNPDSTPPSVAGATVSPAAIDVSAGDQVVTMDMHLTDDVSGVDFDGSPFYYVANVCSPLCRQGYSIPVPDFSLIAGTATDGTWRLTWTTPQYSEAGTWSLSMSFRDNAGNSVFEPAAAMFDVASAVQDLSPPVLTGMSFSPAVIDTSAGPASVTVSLDLTDDLSGVDFSLASPNGGRFHGVFFQSPSNGQFRSACCSQFSMTGGTLLNGTWQTDVFFPQFSEAGTWKAALSGITDHVRNSFFMNAADLEADMFPTDLVVVRPSLVGDGLVGPGGGTVTDETFGDRAEILFPPGAVAGDTDVAIDVFLDPLDVPTPMGFQGPGTYFVNVSLIPEPTYPFAPPGVTVTLPLPDFLNPGTTIPLFVVNTTTGILEPMPDATTGLQVVGVVNPDGLSATFMGISHFSILVGLIPDVIQVSLDIKPGSDPNSIALNSKGVIPVAILTTDTFDATTVDSATVEFGPGGATETHGVRHLEDVDGDGDLDLVLHFKTQETGIQCGATSASLTGETFFGDAIEGSDSIRTVGCK